MNSKWSVLSLLAVFALGGSTPVHADSRVDMGRIAQQRAGSMDRRETTRAPQVQRVDNRRDSARRSEVQRAQPPQQQRAGKADKRR